MTEKSCPSCGRTLGGDAPLGICPECLIKSGLRTGTTAGPPTGRGRFVPPAIEQLQPLFPQLEILEVIGHGGMGAVYKARQTRLDRLVALKVLPPTDGADAGFADRFNREARALARLQHPHIVAVHDFGVAGGLHYLLMEYVDGPNLRQVQRSGGLTPAQALRIIPPICEALQFAHDRGIVHRDIKPENLLLDRDGQVKITDFGIAKLVGPDAETTSLTGAMDVLGTPHYMAPEQIERPADVDHRADIYSLGVVLYELLTGELPLGRFAAPSTHVQVDVRLDEVVLRALEKEPARRYQQVSQVKTRLERIASSPVPASRPARVQPHAVNAVPAMVLYGLQAVFLIAGVQAVWQISRGPGLIGTGGNPFVWLTLHVTMLIAAYIAWGLLHHACWTALPARYRSTSPGRAVGLLLVPIFNGYWLFVSLGQLAAGFNALGDDEPALEIRDAWGLGIAKAVSLIAFWTLAWLPGFTLPICVIDAVLFVLYYRAIAFNARQVILANRRVAEPAVA